MTTTVTDVEKIRRLPWLLAADLLNTTFFLLTFSGTVFLFFLDELGLDHAQIGFLLSLIPFAGIVAPFIAPVVRRFGYKRIYVTFWGIRKFVIALLLLTPAFVARFGPERAFSWVAIIIFVFAMCRAIAETGGYPWKKEAVPDTMRGKFSAINSMSSTVGAILVTAGASYVIGSGTGLQRFMILIATGVVLGLISVWCYSHVPDATPSESGQFETGHLAGMNEALHNRDFMFFLGALGLATLGGTSVISFIPLFMKGQVGLSESNVVLLSIGTYSGALLSSYLWGWAADRYGSKPVMQSSLYFMLLLPLAWFFIPRHSAMSMPLAILIAFVAGIATLAWQISWMRYLFVNAMPSEKKSPYMAVYYAWFGFVSGFGPLLAGWILELSQELSFKLPLVVIDPYTPLFTLSLILLTAGSITVSQLHSEEATSFRRFAGLFLRGNPVRAFNSLVQYNISGTEMTRLLTTERMGDARSPLNTNELIEALNDPSFNVRYQAVASIGRMPPEPELVEALLDVLNEGKSELSFIVIRSLGRLGDPRAIPPLRKLLFSGYHLLEANSARALAMLGDAASIPYFLEKFRTESNQVLRIAYASALGKLGSTEAIAEIFTLLRQTNIEVQRGEIGLALARIAGDERYYMQHWRSLRANPNTAIAQAILALQKSANRPGATILAELAGQSAESFAQSDSAKGVALLKEMICQAPLPESEPALKQILDECTNSLEAFGDTRIEFILLSLHTLNITLHQNGH
jgi:HEAT repeat protein/MFS family permease